MNLSFSPMKMKFRSPSSQGAVGHQTSLESFHSADNYSRAVWTEQQKTMALLEVPPSSATAKAKHLKSHPHMSGPTSSIDEISIGKLTILTSKRSRS